jgi:hypothetical protein
MGTRDQDMGMGHENGTWEWAMGCVWACSNQTWVAFWASCLDQVVPRRHNVCTSSSTTASTWAWLVDHMGHAT